MDALGIVQEGLSIFRTLKFLQLSKILFFL